MTAQPSKDHDFYLPSEIWTLVFEDLAPQDWSQIRLVNSVFKELATPLRFKTVKFQFNSASIFNLARISCAEGLATHVRRLELYGMQRMMEFTEMEEWEESVDLPAEDENIDSCVKNNLMSHREWSSLSLLERTILFNKYNADRLAIDNQLHLLVENPSGLSVVDVLVRILLRFTKLTEFTQFINKYLGRRWITHWQGLRLDPSNFSQNSGYECYERACGMDEDADALALACVLQALGQIKNDLKMFNMMKLQVEGPAFWGPSRLWRLWEDGHQQSFRMLRDEYRDAVEADEEILADLEDDHFATLSRSLDVMASAFERLVRLDYSHIENDSLGGLVTASKTVSNFLCQAKCLNFLRLSFCGVKNGVTIPRLYYSAHYDGGSALLNLLAEHKPWPRIEQLQLEITTGPRALLKFMGSLGPSLRILTLSNITLIPELHTESKKQNTGSGCHWEHHWEYVLPEITHSLPRLERLTVVMLCFFRISGLLVSPRALFDPIMAEEGNRCECLDSYAKAVDENLLKKRKGHVPFEFHRHCTHLRNTFNDPSSSDEDEDEDGEEEHDSNYYSDPNNDFESDE